MDPQGRVRRAGVIVDLLRVNEKLHRVHRLHGVVDDNILRTSIQPRLKVNACRAQIQKIARETDSSLQNRLVCDALRKKGDEQRPQLCVSSHVELP